VALIFAAGYVVISVVGLIVGRRWLAELGPFKASEPIARLERGAEGLEKDLGDALGIVEDLKQRLFESDEALTQARSDIAFLLDQVDRMEDKKEGVMMPPEHRKRLQDNQLKIERTLERNQAALEVAGRKSAKYSRTLTSSGEEIQSARSALRKRGYLK
jgi:chromosome segregation ATPase